jgi:Holliday junction resolvase RusA-like endonuclease
MEVEVRWVPVPQGSWKYVGNGRVVHTKAKELDEWRAAIRNRVDAYRDAHPEHGLPYTGAVVMRLIVSLARPPSVSRRKRPYPSVKPDLDKLARSVCDALHQCGAIGDDSQVVEFTRLAKTYVNEDPEALEVPGCRIVVLPIAPPTEVKGSK